MGHFAWLPLYVITFVASATVQQATSLVLCASLLAGPILERPMLTVSVLCLTLCQALHSLGVRGVILYVVVIAANEFLILSIRRAFPRCTTPSARDLPWLTSLPLYLLGLRAVNAAEWGRTAHPHKLCDQEEQAKPGDFGGVWWASRPRDAPLVAQCLSRAHGGSWATEELDHSAFAYSLSGVTWAFSAACRLPVTLRLAALPRDERSWVVRVHTVQVWLMSLHPHDRWLRTQLYAPGGDWSRAKPPATRYVLLATRSVTRRLIQSFLAYYASTYGFLFRAGSEDGLDHSWW